jgi:hypothetical protein
MGIGYIVLLLKAASALYQKSTPNLYRIHIQPKTKLIEQPILKSSIINLCDPVSKEHVPLLTGNEKRIASCKKVGGEKKKVGHTRESDFKQKYNPKTLDAKIEYGATSDTQIDANHPINLQIESVLGLHHETPKNEWNCSNKSGNNLQFTLGKIPELETEDNLEWIQSKENSRMLFNKYLKKSESAAPADLMVYKEESKWIFFNMDHVVDYIVEHAIWRKLDTGRLKGDFEDNSKKGISQYLTYEYRTNHKSYFLGLNGGKGKPFIELLKQKIPYIEDSFL